MNKLGKGIILRGKTYWFQRMVEGSHLQISLHTGDPLEALLHRLSQADTKF